MTETDSAAPVNCNAAADAALLVSDAALMGAVSLWGTHIAAAGAPVARLNAAWQAARAVPLQG
ncbi:hypothetical protein [Ruegeria halocynthiae]|uniref:hypothetical protein n=1 Tax=Ruegeria halocynthiae TaxID=985054 RepID=UPI00159FF1E7|nr:hypothetical protein [Ruegeria halocynthiae]